MSGQLACHQTATRRGRSSADLPLVMHLYRRQVLSIGLLEPRIGMTQLPDLQQLSLARLTGDRVATGYSGTVVPVTKTAEKHRHEGAIPHATQLTMSHALISVHWAAAPGRAAAQGRAAAHARMLVNPTSALRTGFADRGSPGGRLRRLHPRRGEPRSSASAHCLLKTLTHSLDCFHRSTLSHSTNRDVPPLCHHTAARG